MYHPEAPDNPGYDKIFFAIETALYREFELPGTISSLSLVFESDKMILKDFFWGFLFGLQFLFIR